MKDTGKKIGELAAEKIRKQRMKLILENLILDDIELIRMVNDPDYTPDWYIDINRRMQAAVERWTKVANESLEVEESTDDDSNEEEDNDDSCTIVTNYE